VSAFGTSHQAGAGRIAIRGFTFRARDGFF